MYAKQTIKCVKKAAATEDVNCANWCCGAGNKENMKKTTNHANGRGKRVEKRIGNMIERENALRTPHSLESHLYALWMGKLYMETIRKI